MAVTVAEGVVVVTADADGVPGDVTAALRRGQNGITSAGDDAGRGWVDSFKGSFLGNALSTVAIGAATQIGEIIGTGIRAAWDFAWDSIDVASGLNEAQTAIDQVFGGGAGTVNAFAETAAKSLGQSELAALKAAQTFGIYGNAAGLANEENAKFSTDLVKLASDFASFYDTSPEQAIEAIGAALRGESEPLRSYGVLLDDATIRARAMSMGLIQSSVDMTKVEGAQLKLEAAQKKVNDETRRYGSESLQAREAAQGVKEAQEALAKATEGATSGPLTQQQRVLAAQAEIFAQAGAAADDFGRTSDGLANQQRILAAQFEDAKGKLGESLLPVMLELTSFANEQFMPAFSDIIAKIGPELGDALIESMPAITDLLEAFVELLPPLTDLTIAALPLFVDGMKLILPVMQFATELNTGFYDTLMAIFGLITGDTSLQQFGDRATQTSGTIGWLNNVLASVGGFVSNFMGWIDRATGVVSWFRDRIGDVGRAAGEMGAAVGIGVANAGGAIAGLAGKVQGAVAGAGTWLYNSGRAVIEGFISGIRSMVDSVSRAVGGVLDFARGFFPNSPAKRGPFSGAGWTNLKRSGGAVIDEWAAGMREAAPSVPFDLMGIVTPGGSQARLGGAAYGVPSSASAAATMTASSGAPFVAGDLIVNEATDPLGSVGRIASELRMWKA